MGFEDDPRLVRGAYLVYQAKFWRVDRVNADAKKLCLESASEGVADPSTGEVVYLKRWVPFADILRRAELKRAAPKVQAA